MNDKEHSIEILHHYLCRVCKKWWTIGDAPEDRVKWWCPWCGEEGGYKVESKRDLKN